MSLFRFLIAFPFFYFTAGLYFDLPLTSAAFVIFFLLFIGLQLMAYYKLKERLANEAILLVPRESGPKDLLVALLLVGGYILLIYLVPGLGQKGEAWLEPVGYAFLIGYIILQSSLFRKYEEDYYFTEKGIIKGIQITEDIRWKKVAACQIQEQYGLIKLKRRKFGVHFLQTDKDWLAKNQVQLQAWIDQRLAKS